MPRPYWFYSGSVSAAGRGANAPYTLYYERIDLFHKESSIGTWPKALNVDDEQRTMPLGAASYSASASTVYMQIPCQQARFAQKNRSAMP